MNYSVIVNIPLGDSPITVIPVVADGYGIHDGMLQFWLEMAESKQPVATFIPGVWLGVLEAKNIQALALGMRTIDTDEAG